MNRPLHTADSPDHDDTSPSLRAAEERSVFLAALSHKLASVADPDQLVAVAMRELGEWLGVHRAFFFEVDAGTAAYAHVLPDWRRHGDGMTGTYPLASFGTADFWTVAAGAPVAVDDVRAHRATAASAGSYTDLDIGAMLLAPFVREGRWVASVTVTEAHPRAWTRDESLLLEHVAARVWPLVERARVARDLEETRRAAEQQSRLFSTTLAAVRDYVFTYERDGRVAFANASLLQLWGIDAADAVGRSLRELGHGPEVEQQLLHDVERVVATRRSVTGETAYTAPSGFTGHYEYTLSPVFDADGDVVQVAGTAREVSQRRAAQADLASALARERAARAEAERSSRVKDDFLATLSHELRTPLNAILGWAQMVRRPDAAPEDVDHGLAVIERNARAQAQLIDDLLDMSRITSGKLHLDIQPVLVRDVFDAAMAIALPVAASKDLQLTARCTPPTLLVAADPHRLQQVVWNLLSNAVKFTPAGGMVSLSAMRSGDAVQIEVSDTGVGIASDFLPHVFDPFRQADASTTRRHGGLGLGLAIVKHLVELHGGSVEALSEGLQTGARFQVRLPVAPPTVGDLQDTRGEAAAPRQPPASARPCTTLDGLQVLIVDDDADARELARHVVERCGGIVEVAASAAEALSQVRARPFHVLVSDIGMPGQDGYALLQDVRRGGYGDGVLPAIALTAFAGDDTATRAALAGFQRHLAKPIVPDALIAAIASLVSAAADPSSPRLHFPEELP